MKIEYIFIKSRDGYCDSEELFKHFLGTNTRLEFEKAEDSEKQIYFDGIFIKYKIKLDRAERTEEDLFHFVIEIEDADDDKIEKLEELDQVIREINQKMGNLFLINTIWNDIDLYYGEKLYPQISEVENKLRKIIYLLMLKTIGSEWFDKGTPQKFQKDINNVVQKNNKSEADIAGELLRYADFITLGKFFTAPYALQSDLKKLFAELSKYVYDKDEKDRELGLTKEILKDLSDKYEPKNNWDRYFSNKLSAKNSNKFSKDWSSLYDLRNKVAHGKQIRKDDYTKAQKLIDMFTKDFDECIKIIDSLEMTAEQAEAVEAVAQQVIQKKAETIKEPEIIAFSKYGRDLSDGTMLATTIHPALEAATLMGYPSSVNSDRIYSIMNGDLSQRYYDAPKLFDYKPKTEPYLWGMTEDGKITNELDKILNLNLTNSMFSNEIIRTGIADEHLSKKAESIDEELNGNANISGVK